jgi:hypothetical protein
MSTYMSELITRKILPNRRTLGKKRKRKERIVSRSAGFNRNVPNCIPKAKKPAHAMSPVYIKPNIKRMTVSVLDERKFFIIIGQVYSFAPPVRFEPNPPWYNPPHDTDHADPGRA